MGRNSPLRAILSLNRRLRTLNRHHTCRRSCRYRRSGDDPPQAQLGRTRRDRWIPPVASWGDVRSHNPILSTSGLLKPIFAPVIEPGSVGTHVRGHVLRGRDRSDAHENDQLLALLIERVRREHVGCVSHNVGERPRYSVIECGSEIAMISGHGSGSTPGIRHLTTACGRPAPRFWHFSLRNAPALPRGATREETLGVEGAPRLGALRLDPEKTDVLG
jgi:hypothetical protein